MATLDRTRALIDGLARALGLAALPADNSGGVRLMIGAATEVMVFGGDDVTVLIVAPIAALPRGVGYGLALYLLRANLFDADTAPFQVAADATGTLVFWGRVPIDAFDGAGLAGLLVRVAARVAQMRAEIDGGG